MTSDDALRVSPVTPSTGLPNRITEALFALMREKGYDPANDDYDHDRVRSETGEIVDAVMGAVEPELARLRNEAAFIAADRDAALSVAQARQDRVDTLEERCAALTPVGRRNAELKRDMDAVEEENDRLRAEHGGALGEADAFRARVMELTSNVAARNARIAELDNALAHATRFEVGPVTVTPHGDGWRCWRPDPEWHGRPDQAPTLTEGHPDRETALARARELAADT